MYHPGTPYIPQVLCCCGFLCTITFILGGAIGVLLKSKLPSIAMCADIVGLSRKGFSIFKVIVACRISQHHRYIWEQVFVLYRPAMKWSFHVLMARSTAFIRWICCGTNWYSISFCLLFLEANLCLIIHPIYPCYVSSIGQVFHFIGIWFQYMADGPTLEGCC